jgi:dynein intermediate chain 3, axonemal
MTSSRNYPFGKVGEDQPLFTSSQANTYLTGGVWSPTRPAVVILSGVDGSLLVWDFTDSSSKHSLEFKPTHSQISSMDFLTSSTQSSIRQQLLAIGDITGTLHIFEIPRNLSRPVHKEEKLMANFFERELKVF